MIGAETFNKSANYESKNIFKRLFPQDPHNQFGHKIKLFQILYVNYTLYGYFKTLFVWTLTAFFFSLQGGTKMDILLVQKCQFSVTLVTPHST